MTLAILATGKKRVLGARGGASAFALSAVFATLTAGIALTGCGGHHSSSSASGTTLTATINWPARSRDTGITNVSAAAQAAIITVTPGDPNSGDPIDFPPIIRTPTSGTNPLSAFSQSWSSSPTQVARTNVRVQIRFYSTLPTGSTNNVPNDTIATNYKDIPSAGDADFHVQVGNTMTDIGTFAATGTIATLTVPATAVPFGASTTLQPTATDATGKITIALPSGSVFFSGPSDFPITINPGGDVVATSLGPATVTASISGAATASGTLSTTTAVTAVVGASQLTTQTDGLLVRDTVVGSGAPAANGDSVTLSYTGLYTTDAANNVDSGAYAAFDTAYSAAPRTVTLGDGTLPAGLNEAVLGMKPGSSRIVVIPAAQTAGWGIPASAPAGAPGIYLIARSSGS